MKKDRKRFFRKMKERVKNRMIEEKKKLRLEYEERKKNISKPLELSEKLPEIPEKVSDLLLIYNNILRS